MIDTIENERDTGAGEEGAPHAGGGSGAARFLIFAAILGVAFAGWRYFGPSSALASGGWIADWDQAVEKSQQTGKPALALFTADWCPACKTFESQVLSDAKVQEYLRDNYTLAVVDLSDRSGPNSRRAAEFGVRAIPTLILYGRDGQEQARANGMSATALRKWLDSNGTGGR